MTQSEPHWPHLKRKNVEATVGEQIIANDRMEIRIVILRTALALY